MACLAWQPTIQSWRIESGFNRMTDASYKWDESWTSVNDIVVVGTGAAGFAAALAAASEGRSVVMIEKAEHTGGTTARSSGTMWIPNNPLMQQHGIDDPREEAIRYLAKSSYPTDYHPGRENLGLDPLHYSLLEALYDEGAPAFELLSRLGALPVEDREYPSMPDYYAEYPENAAPLGRSIRIRMPAGYRPGVGESGGQVLLNHMTEAARTLGVEIITGRRVTELIRDEDGTVVGVGTASRFGVELFGAARGVVFATGGFLHNQEMTSTYLRGPILGGSGAAEATGDFLQIGVRSGAKLGNMANAWWDQVVVENVARSRVTSRDCVYPFGDSMVIVNKHGDRVMNEKRTYNERGQVHHHWNPDTLEYSNFLLYMIFDDDVLNDTRATRFRFPVPDENGGEENVISAQTLDELAVAIQERVATLADSIGAYPLAQDFAPRLRATIERFNELAASGVDTDHSRGGSAIEAAWATEPRTADQTNPTMFPLSRSGPYHCIILGPGALDTKGGPVIDAHARVLTVDDEPLDGLFGAGNCIASPTGQGYYGPGGTIGPALTFGVIAGRSAAARPVHEPVIFG
jgi:3-oxosteroid 1-dehydrogenase